MDNTGVRRTTLISFLVCSIYLTGASIPEGSKENYKHMQLPHVNTHMHSVTATAYFLLSKEIPQQINKLQIRHLTRYFVIPVMNSLLDTVKHASFSLSYRTHFIHAQLPICQKWKSIALMYFPLTQVAMLQSSTTRIRHMCPAEWWINMHVFWHVEQKENSTFSWTAGMNNAHAW